ncbi:MAG: rod shape-determining protein RodA [Planctomycetota bacterium]
MSAGQRPDWRRLDYRILTVLAALSVLSLVFIHSAGYDPGTGEYEPYWKKQFLWIVLSVAAVAVLLRVPYRLIVDRAYVLYALGFLLLLLLPVLGTERNHARRWLNLGFLLLQPSEVMKVILVIALARYIRWRDDYKKLRGLVRPFLLTLAPMALILNQPDLGTAILFVPILFALLYVAGARGKHLALVILMGILSLPVLFFGFMKEYQQERVYTFLKQSGLSEQERRNEAYHLQRSMTAIGSGGLHGKGLGKGEQRVPFNETDFVFTVVAEEWGFLGSVLVMLLYGVLFVLLAMSAAATREPSGKLLIVGVLTLLLAQTAVNMGMTVGLAPITGLTLPYFSYGGSSLLSLALAIGLVLNVRLHPDYVWTDDFDRPGA